MIPKSAVTEFLVKPPRGAGFYKIRFTGYRLSYVMTPDGQTTDKQRLWSNGQYGSFIDFVFVSDDDSINGASASTPAGSCWDEEGNLSPEIEKIKNQGEKKKVLRRNIEGWAGIFESAGLNPHSEEGMDPNRLVDEYGYIHWHGIPEDRPAGDETYKFGNLAKSDWRTGVKPFLTAAEYEDRLENMDPETRTFYWRNKPAETSTDTEDETPIPTIDF